MNWKRMTSAPPVIITYSEYMTDLEKYLSDRVEALEKELEKTRGQLYHAQAELEVGRKWNYKYTKTNG